MYKIGIECESIEENETWGVGRIVKKLLEEISRRPELQKEFKFFLYFKSKIPDLPYLNNPIFVKKRVKLPAIPPSFSLYYYFLLPVKLYFEGLDLIFFPNYMLPIVFRGKSLVVLTEDIYYEINQGVLPWRYKLAYKIFAGWAAKHATKIMAISEASARETSKLFHINPDRIVANPLGVNMPVNPSSMPRTPYPKPYILYVGQAFPRRHLKEAMLAFEQIAPRFKELKLIAVGKDKYSPPITEQLKSKINRHLGGEKIIHKNYVSESELAGLYANAELVIYVSSKEAFGLPPLEALGYSVPAVVADAEISHEVFGDKAFFVANPDNPHSIAEAIADGLTNRTKRKAIANSAVRILGKYTWTAHTNRFLEIAKSIIQ